MCHFIVCATAHSAYFNVELFGFIQTLELRLKAFPVIHSLKLFSAISFALKLDTFGDISEFVEFAGRFKEADIL